MKRIITIVFISIAFVLLVSTCTTAPVKEVQEQTSRNEENQEGEVVQLYPSDFLEGTTWEYEFMRGDFVAYNGFSVTNGFVTFYSKMGNAIDSSDEKETYTVVGDEVWFKRSDGHSNKYKIVGDTLVFKNGEHAYTKK